MFKKYILLMLFSLAFGGSGNTLNSIDKFITSHCGPDCNGEGNLNCRPCYNEAVELFDQRSPVSPEGDFDLNVKGGKLELDF